MIISKNLHGAFQCRLFSYKNEKYNTGALIYTHEFKIMLRQSAK